jgi:hypothetical protein
MAWQTISYKLTSSAPLIMHNGQMADPLNKWAILKKQIASKRNKTEADLREIAHIEFLGSLYMDENGPILPDFMIDAMVINGAKKSKEGMIAKSGCFCLEHAKLEYNGPRDAEELWNDEHFRFSAMVRIGNSRVSCMRPIFYDWTATIKLNIEDTMVNVSRVDEWLNAAGTQVGLGDWRPQHGRFTSERLNGKK